MMKKLIKSALCFLLILQLFASGCSWSGQKEESIKIGAVYGLSGPTASLGQQYQNGALLAVKEINKDGGINGKQIKLIIEDSQFDTKLAVSAFQKLTEIDKVKYVSSLGSSIALALKPLAEEKGVLLFSSGANPQITENSRLVLRHSNISSSDARIVAEDLAKHQPKILGLIYLNDDWGVAFNEEFTKQANILLPNTEVTAVSHLPSDTDFRSAITKILGKQPEAVVVASFGAPVGLIIKQLKEMGYNGQIFANNGLVISKDAQQILGKENLKGIYYQTYKDVPADFISLYKSEFRTEPDLYSIFVYTDMEILANAIKKVGENPEDIARFVKGLGEFNGRFENVQISPSGDMIIETVMKVWE